MHTCTSLQHMSMHEHDRVADANTRASMRPPRRIFAFNLWLAKLDLSAFDVLQGLCGPRTLSTCMVCPALTSYYCCDVETPARSVA